MAVKLFGVTAKLVDDNAEEAQVRNDRHDEFFRQNFGLLGTKFWF